MPRPGCRRQAMAMLAAATALAGCGDDGDARPREATALERATSARDGVPFRAVVRITPDGFQPRKVTVLTGGSVTWINVDRDRLHTAESASESYRDMANGQDASFDSHTLGWEEPFTHVFSVPGDFEYASSYDTWRGVVSVVERPRN